MKTTNNSKPVKQVNLNCIHIKRSLYYPISKIYGPEIITDIKSHKLTLQTRKLEAQQRTAQIKVVQSPLLLLHEVAFISWRDGLCRLVIGGCPKRRRNEHMGYISIPLFNISSLLDPCLNQKLFCSSSCTLSQRSYWIYCTKCPKTH